MSRAPAAFVAIQPDYATSTALLLSDDGINWEVLSDPWLGSGAYSITCGNGLYVIGTDRSEVYTSPDGYSWTYQTTVASRCDTLYFANGIFFLGINSSSGQMYTSTDGQSWTSRDSKLTSTPNGFGYGNGVYVVVGDGQLSTSSNGTTWTAVSAGTTVMLECVGYGNGRWIAGGLSGYGTQSTNDAVTWAQYLSSTTTRYFVDYRSGLWVRGGWGGSNPLETSTNGKSWTGRNSRFGSAAIRDFAHSDDLGVSVIVGDGGNISSSTNRTTWTSRRSSGEQILGVAAYAA